jgi:hypothetical protein
MPTLAIVEMQGDHQAADAGGFRVGRFFLSVPETSMPPR